MTDLPSATLPCGHYVQAKLATTGQYDWSCECGWPILPPEAKAAVEAAALEQARVVIETFAPWCRS